MPELAITVLRVTLAVIFVAMGALHFVPNVARGMAAMIPPALVRPGLPSRRALVVFTGLCEIAGGIGLLVPQTRLAAGIALIVFLIAVFPANAYAATDPTRFGRAAIPFWPRLIAQLVLIALIIVAML